MRERVVGLVARIPVPISTKLLVAFLAVVALLFVIAGVGLRELSEANQRAGSIVSIERKILAYRELQNETTSQLYSIVSAVAGADQRTLDTTRQQLNELGLSFQRLQVVARDQPDLLAAVQTEYDNFVMVVTRVVDLLRSGKLSEGLDLQLTKANPSADRLERLMNQLVNRGQADMVATIELNREAYESSRLLMLSAAFGSIALALVLGYAISSSIVGPVRRTNTRLRQIGLGDFTTKIEVANRDELGTLAASVNQMSDELGRLYRELDDRSREIAATSRQLEVVSRHKSEFLANMSHELRTPLNAVIGFSEVLREKLFGPLNEKQHEYIVDINTAGTHLLSLINDILDLAKVEAGKMELQVSEFSLPETLRSSLVIVRERLARHGIRSELSIGPGVGMIAADERRVLQVLFNLLTNAAKFTPDGGRIDVRAELSDGEIQVSVRDSGVGIAPQDLDRIFEEFSQAGAIARDIEGTGLGLPLARRMVELHGGRLTVESVVGMGSTFTFALPLPVRADTQGRPAATRSS
jgi:signal transduction histidine kinase